MAGCLEENAHCYPSLATGEPVALQGMHGGLKHPLWQSETAVGGVHEEWHPVFEVIHSWEWPERNLSHLSAGCSE